MSLETFKPELTALKKNRAMASTVQKAQHRTWRKDQYLISTDPSMVPVPELNAAFASDTVYWADPLPEDAMRETLNNSLCFGLYEIIKSDAPTTPNAGPHNPKFTGFARCVTDFTTFIYLTDVFVDPACQGNGLGAWLLGCVQEVIESMPYLRRSMLFTSDWKRSVPFYEKVMGMSVLEFERGADGKSGEGVAVMQRKGPAFPASLGRKVDDGA